MKTAPEIDFEAGSVKSQILGLLNWYRQETTPKQLATGMATWAKKMGYSPDEVATLKADVPGFSPLEQQNAILAQILLPHIDSDNSEIMELLADLKIKVDKYLKANNAPKKKKSSGSGGKHDIQKAMKEKARMLLGPIDVAIDEIIEHGHSDFNAQEYLKSQNVKPLIVNKFIECIHEEYLDEYQKVAEGDDEELVDAYETISWETIDSLIRFLTDVIADCKTYAMGAKAQRAPRKKKVKPAKDQISKLQYLEKDGKYVSKNPQKIVGASGVWLMNIKYKKLTYLQAATREGFSIKGTTIQNIDADSSWVRSIRAKHYDSVMAAVVAGGKRKIKNALDAFVTKPGAAKGRMNGDTLIVNIDR